MTEERKHIKSKGDYELLKIKQIFRGSIKPVEQYHIEHKRVSIARFTDKDIAENHFEGLFTKEVELKDEAIA